ncbi:hypothetical protein KAR91_11075 [Candidatus Pacearchaeota archaeon]|nr:hypothetical protein [Candidatus Pacearchaeota archaeon]
MLKPIKQIKLWHGLIVVSLISLSGCSTGSCSEVFPKSGYSTALELESLMKDQSEGKYKATPHLWDWIGRLDKHAESLE